MEIGSASVKSIIDLFREELKNDYDEREINQFVLILFNEFMGWSRLQMQLNYKNLFLRKQSQNSITLW